MKNLLLHILMIIPSFLFAQRMQAFDAAISLNVGIRPVQDSHANISAGISGRRLPVSLFIGYGCMEFDNDYLKMKYTHATQWNYNATLMLRMVHIDFRSMDFNLYGTARRTHNDYFYEYGGKLGLLANDRTRLYLSAGEITGPNKYKSVIVGAHITLFFFNGYSAY
jgi:hypothetical protein